MIQNTYELALGLFLIKRISSCNNAYGLVKILERKFDVFTPVEFINNLITNKMIEYIDVNGVKYFTITQLGENFLTQYGIETLLNEMLLNYPQQEDFIKLLKR